VDETIATSEKVWVVRGSSTDEEEDIILDF
jgi:hypothetical protein